MFKSKNNLFNFCGLAAGGSKNFFFKIERRVSTYLKKTNSASSNFDVVIIGGGAIGMSIAFWIKKKSAGAAKVLVIEKDLKVKKFRR